MSIFWLVAIIWTSTPFGDWQTADSIKKMFSVREWRSQQKVIICFKAFIASIPNVILDFIIIRKIAVILTSTPFDDWQTADSIRKCSTSEPEVSFEVNRLI